LVAQSDSDFQLIVLSSARLPEPFRLRLVELLNDTLGADRVAVKFARRGFASKKLATEIQRTYPPDQHIAEVVLDDDDALAQTYVSDLRAILNAKGDWGDYAFVTFPYGLSLCLHDGKVAYQERDIPFTNLGLVLVAKPGSGRNVFAVSHKRIGERHPHFVHKTDYPTYVRTIHGMNDSRGMIGKEFLSEAAIAPIIAQHFPHLVGMAAGVLGG
jgi:Putative rhamnosyl transferase